MSIEVSVIMPVYNAEHTLKKAIDSFVNQTFKNFELICVDDGSKDNSLKILNEYAEQYSFIKILKQKNSGPAKARNYALTESCGNYIMFCDADDWYENNMIEEMVNALVNNNVDIVMCDCNVIDIGNQTVHTQKDIDWCKLRYLGYNDLTDKKRIKINCVIWNKIFRKSIIDKYSITYPVKYEHDDRAFYLKYIFACKTYYGLDKKLYNYIVGNPASISGMYRTKAKSKHQFDYVYSLNDVFDYLNKMQFDIDYKLLLNNTLSSIISFYRRLPDNSKRKAFKITKQFIKRNIKFLRQYDTDYLYLNSVILFKTFDEYMVNKTKVESFYEKHKDKIYSLKTEKARYVINFCGIRIKFKSKKLQKELEQKKLLKKAKSLKQ